MFPIAASPAGCPAPIPGEVAELAVAAEAAFLGVRPSPRSFSGWVVVAWFASAPVADAFARLAASSFGLPFCKVRPAGGWFLVSVPVAVFKFSGVEGAVPYWIIGLGERETFLNPDEPACFYQT